MSAPTWAGTTRSQKITSLTVGSILTALTCIAVAINADEGKRLIAVLVYAFFMAPVFIGATWIAVTYRNFAQERKEAEASIENEWAQKAGFGAFCDLITLLGLTTAMTNIFQWRALPTLAILLLGIASFGIRFLFYRVRGR